MSEIKFTRYLRAFLLHTRNDNIDFQSSILCMQHFSTLISSDLDIHETTCCCILSLRLQLSSVCMSIELTICRRFGRTYTVNMLFKSDSINPCMHTQVATNGAPELSFHVKYESFFFDVKPS